MSGEDSLGLATSRVELACRRIAGLARVIVEAYGFGKSEGPHERPWTAEYHRAAVDVYGKSLPWSYQRDIAALFRQSAETMDELSIPSALAEDWVIVIKYLRGASAAIDRWLSAEESRLLESETADLIAVEDHTPVFVHFDELAELTTAEGAKRLERAALAVQSHMENLSSTELSDYEQHLLEAVASGMKIDEMAIQFHSSPRSMQRELNKLWKALGVHDRTEGMHKAVEKGLVDGVERRRHRYVRRQ